MGRKSGAMIVGDARSVKAIETLLAEWRQLKKTGTPQQRRSFLDSSKGIIALGAKTCRQLLKELERAHKRIAGQACTASWLDAYAHDGAAMPYAAPADGRQNAVRMLLSRETTRMTGDASASPEETIATRRWTPPHAVNVEDQMDALSHLEAAHYQHPASPSALVILQIGYRYGHTAGDVYRTGRSKAIAVMKNVKDAARAARRQSQ